MSSPNGVIDLAKVNPFYKKQTRKIELEIRLGKNIEEAHSFDMLA